MAGITYVMLSRICALNQLYILEDFDETKMFPSQIALKELDRLKNISMNSNPTDWDKEDSRILKISSLNCRSLKKHFLDIKSDDILLKSNVICLQETWLDDGEALENFEIPNYELHLNSYGRGKGLAIYYQKEIAKHEMDVKHENIQLSLFSCENIDLVAIYRSRNGNHEVLTQIIETLLEREKPILVIGDFNFCYNDNSSNLMGKYLSQHDFKQLVTEPTHIEGNILDHAYVHDTREINTYSMVLQSKYYSDHKGVGILAKR